MLRCGGKGGFANSFKAYGQLCMFKSACPGECVSPDPLTSRHMQCLVYTLQSKYAHTWELCCATVSPALRAQNGKGFYRSINPLPPHNKHAILLALPQESKQGISWIIVRPNTGRQLKPIATDQLITRSGSMPGLAISNSIWTRKACAAQIKPATWTWQELLLSRKLHPPPPHLSCRVEHSFLFSC